MTNKSFKQSLLLGGRPFPGLPIGRNIDDYKFVNNETIPCSQCGSINTKIVTYEEINTIVCSECGLESETVQSKNKRVAIVNYIWKLINN